MHRLMDDPLRSQFVPFFLSPRDVSFRPRLFKRATVKFERVERSRSDRNIIVNYGIFWLYSTGWT